MRLDWEPGLFDGLHFEFEPDSPDDDEAPDSRA